MVVFSRGLRPAGAAPVGRRAVPGLRVRRAGALDLLRQRACPDRRSSLVANADLVTQGLLSPAGASRSAAVLAGLVDFAIRSCVLVVVLLWFGVVPGRGDPACCPPWSLLVVVAALGRGLWLAALNVRYRDVRYAMPFLVQLWLFATPVAYPASLVRRRLAARCTASTPWPAWWRASAGRSSAAGDRPRPRSSLVSPRSPSSCWSRGLRTSAGVERSFADVI